MLLLSIANPLGRIVDTLCQGAKIPVAVLHRRCMTTKSAIRRLLRENMGFVRLCLLDEWHQAPIRLQRGKAIWIPIQGCLCRARLIEYGLAVFFRDTRHPSTVCLHRAVQPNRVLKNHIAYRTHVATGQSMSGERVR